MNLPTRSNHHGRQIFQDKFDEREVWHKLVVKIINWKDGLRETSIIKDKITSKEWRTYCSKMLQINVSSSKQKIMENLKELKKTISNHNGFS